MEWEIGFSKQNVAATLGSRNGNIQVQRSRIGDDDRIRSVSQGCMQGRSQQESLPAHHPAG